MSAVKEMDAAPAEAAPASAPCLAWPDCPQCRTTLEAHQLDDRYPDRVLGYCPECAIIYFLSPQGDGEWWTILGPVGLAAAG